jgi:hypothetical protein
MTVLRGRIILTLITVVALLTTSEARSDETGSTTYAQIEPSLALVMAGHGKNVGFGSAFCISDIGNNNGYLLTNRHVVANDQYPRVILMSNSAKVLAASVIRTSPLDAAVLLIPSDCQPLHLSTGPPIVGTKIALAGFPSIQLRAALLGLGLSPSFHEGTISSILDSVGALEYDAQTDHGNSGSPLFDVNTGTVYGLVTAVNTGETGALQNNFAIGTWALAPFLQNAHAMASYVNGSGVASEAVGQGTSLPDIAGTYVGTLYDNIAGSGAFTVTILQEGKTLTGTWAVQFASSYRYNNSGEVRGVMLSSTSAAFYLISSVSSACPYLATVIVEAGRLRGTYASHNCTFANGGSFAASK